MWQLSEIFIPVQQFELWIEIKNMRIVYRCYDYVNVVYDVKSKLILYQCEKHANCVLMWPL